MRDIKVLGSGCAKCKLTMQAIEEVAQQQGVQINLQKVDDIRDIMAYRVLSTPGVVVDGKVVHVGSVPSRELIASWLH
ncbi:MAG: thioredoxin family protein [Archangium sp.]|nr:thioredoxin family protein [Archangium sp.]